MYNTQAIPANCSHSTIEYHKQKVHLFNVYTQNIGHVWLPVSSLSV